MNEVWLSIKAWTQRIILAALVLYAGLFIYNNSGGEPINFWYWFKHTHPTSVFKLSAAAFIVGIIFTILINTGWKTLRQIRELRSRSRQDKMERDLSDMKLKAAMLQTRPAAPSEGVTMQVDRLGGN